MADDESDRPLDATGPNEGLPWYVKAAIVLVLLIVGFIIVVDLFEFAAAL